MSDLLCAGLAATAMLEEDTIEGLASTALALGLAGGGDDAAHLDLPAGEAGIGIGTGAGTGVSTGRASRAASGVCSGLVMVIGRITIHCAGGWTAGVLT